MAAASLYGPMTPFLGLTSGSHFLNVDYYVIAVVVVIVVVVGGGRFLRGEREMSRIKKVLMSQEEDVMLCADNFGFDLN